MFIGIVRGYSFDWCFCICGFAVFVTAVYSSFWDNVSMCLMQSCLRCFLYGLLLLIEVVGVAGIGMLVSLCYAVVW